MSKSLIYLCAGIFGTIGAYIPVLLGDSGLGGWSILGGLIGGLLGIWAAFKLNNYI